MPGAIIFVICMVLVVPVGVMFGGAIWSALFGWMSVDDAEARAMGTPYEVERESSDS